MHDRFRRLPSQTGSGFYTVIVQGDETVCECPDFELRSKPCKHILGVRLYVKRQEDGEEQETSREPVPKLPRKTYPQDWPNYNAAQVNEQGHFQDLLADLCGTMEEPARAGPAGAGLSGPNVTHRVGYGVRCREG
ncbi:MAG: transposase, family protein/SWIM domain fusion [Gemmataceae bacterium]|nr:transposase, family protein/SWIM domain fusion [Gemmataceae bacterium]